MRQSTLDSGFGSGGMVQTDWGGQDEAYALTVQPDGRILVGGWGAGHFALARYQGR
jgi:hypothetical protein